MAAPGDRLWLWKNGSHFWAFETDMPVYPGGDPMTLGEPVGYAILKTSAEPPDLGMVMTEEPPEQAPISVDDYEELASSLAEMVKTYWDDGFLPDEQPAMIVRALRILRLVAPEKYRELIDG